MAKKSSAAGISLKQDQKWQAEMDLDTLMRAEQIEADPKRFKAAAELAKERMVALGAVASEADSGEK